MPAEERVGNESKWNSFKERLRKTAKDGWGHIPKVLQNAVLYVLAPVAPNLWIQYWANEKWIPTADVLAHVDDKDVEKLHLESLQLRNQQFLIGTLALTGSGLSVWLLPGFASGPQSVITPTMLVVGNTVWLGLMALLFYWAILLRTFIATISYYLSHIGASKWEAHLRVFGAFRPKIYTSHTTIVSWMFAMYGAVVVLAHFVPGVSHETPLSGEPGLRALSFVLLCCYWLFIFILYWQSRYIDQAISAAWVNIVEVRPPQHHPEIPPRRSLLGIVVRYGGVPALFALMIIGGRHFYYQNANDTRDYAAFYVKLRTVLASIDDPDAAVNAYPALRVMDAELDKLCSALHQLSPEDQKVAVEASTDFGPSINRNAQKVKTLPDFKDELDRLLDSIVKKVDQLKKG